MLVLSFHVGAERYAVPCRHVVEVTPRVRFQPVPHAPAFVAGIAAYRGGTLPVIDLGQLFVGRPTPDRISSRVIVAETSSGQRLGLYAERVTEAVTVAERDVQPGPIKLGDAEYLGGLFREGDAFTQLVEVEHLIPPEVSALLAAAPGEPGAG